MLGPDGSLTLAGGVDTDQDADFHDDNDDLVGADVAGVRKLSDPIDTYI